MKIPGPLILLGYILASGVLMPILTGWKKENQIGVALLVVAFFIGWFFVISYLVERENERENTHVAVRTVKTGFETLKLWMAYILALLVIGAIGSFFII